MNQFWKMEEVRRILNQLESLKFYIEIELVMISRSGIVEIYIGSSVK